jgi:hypothetical protein
MQAVDLTSMNPLSLTPCRDESTAMIAKFEASMYSAQLMLDARELSSMSFLWRSVLGQSIRDIYGGNSNQRGEVIRWLATPDFLIVCEYAEVEPDCMREQLASLIAMPRDLSRKYGKMLRDRVVGTKVMVSPVNLSSE